MKARYGNSALNFLNWSGSMKVGDLVEIEKWCRNKGRRGIVTEVPKYLSCVKIVYLDTGEISNALKDNLILLSSS
jgi:hypothetical protein